MELVKKKIDSKQTMYELIFMDFFMPSKNGLEVSTEIRKYLSENMQESDLRPYIHIITSGDIQKIAEIAAQGVVDDMSQKPIFRAGVLKLLEKAGMFNQ